jgi:alpha-tubulin suppressor-like RCC1 family protein
VSPDSALPGPVTPADSGAGFETTVASSPRFRARRVVPIIASAGILVLAGVGFLAYWLLTGHGGSSSPATEVSAGHFHTCALLSDCTVKCWGENEAGQLGDGSMNHRHKNHIYEDDFSPTPVQVNGITNASAISAGHFHTCALLSDGTIKCWGDNDDGQLGDGSMNHGHKNKWGQDFNQTPVQVSSITNASAVSAGYSHTCALLSDRTVKCWGNNKAGRLGDGSMNHGHKNGYEEDVSPTPVQVNGITNASAISSGADYACALLSDRTVKCWGSNLEGELGNGTATNSSTPVRVSGITNASAISAGDSHACALLSGGKVECWGGSTFGELGDGSANHGHEDSFEMDFSPTPVQVSVITSAAAIDAGSSHSCALLSDGTVECWGGNSAGQLGNGNTDDSSTPVQVSNITNASAISAGYSHTCALLSGGKVECWGENPDGRLGNGTTTNRRTPVSVAGLG